MQLNVKEVADFFRIAEKVVYCWVDRNEIPHFRVNDQYRFNRAELLEWAAARKMPLYHQAETGPEALCTSVAAALNNGGIYYQIDNRDRDSFLRRLINLLPLPDQLDRDFAFQTISAKPHLGLTDLGNGLVIPQIRHPLVADVAVPMLTICFSAAGLPLNINENGGHSAVFFLVSSDVHMHQHIVSKLAFLLENQALRQLLIKQVPAREIITAFERAEMELHSRTTEK